MAFNSSAFQTGIMQKLVVVAQEFMNVMAQKVKQNRLPKAITENTMAESPKKTNNTYSIDVVIDTSEGAAPMAGAYEWGSGEHGETGEAYVIESRTPGGKLVIPRARWPKYVEDEDDLMQGIYRDPIILPYVLHPGVKPKPYIKPSILESKDKIKKILGREFKAQILSQTKRLTIIDATK